MGVWRCQAALCSVCIRDAHNSIVIVLLICDYTKQYIPISVASNTIHSNMRCYCNIHNYNTIYCNICQHQYNILQYMYPRIQYIVLYCAQCIAMYGLPTSYCTTRIVLRIRTLLQESYCIKIGGGPSRSDLCGIRSGLR